MILAVERIGASEAELVATVGRIQALPGAQNVIPGSVSFTIDMRCPADAVRDRAHKTLVPALRDIARRRRVEVEVDTYQTNPATALDPLVIDAVGEAIAACGQEPLKLASGAGHDAMIMAGHCPSGMIFLRCKDGISHNPAESITVADADIGVQALLEAVRGLDRRLG
jgi:acetylornithine deacetylase/succinyl-diaminopimelate desuccinylase-like protein